MLHSLKIWSGFELQSWPKYMRQTLVLVWISALREKFNFNFWTVFCSYWQNFHFGKKTGQVRQLVGQPVYTMFITNNHDSFHMWWKENLGKHWKVSKYYDQDRLKNILLHFTSLLRAPIFKNSHFLAEIFFLSF